MVGLRLLACLVHCAGKLMVGLLHSYLFHDNDWVKRALSEECVVDQVKNLGCGFAVALDKVVALEIGEKGHVGCCQK